MDPRRASSPAAGSLAMTTPALTVSSKARTTLGVRWARFSARSAACVVRPLTVGTVVVAPGPATKNSAVATASRISAISVTRRLGRRPFSPGGMSRRRRSTQGRRGAVAGWTTSVRGSAIVELAGAEPPMPVGRRSSSPVVRPRRACRISASISLASRGRLSGSRALARATSRSSSTGTVLTRLEGAGTLLWTCW